MLNSNLVWRGMARPGKAWYGGAGNIYGKEGRILSEF